MLGTLLSGAAQLGVGMLGSAYKSHLDRKNTSFANKEAWQYYKRQRALDLQYDQGPYFDLDKAYNEWFQKLNYDWSQRYAENSAKWGVTGLINAGLNPILAANNGFQSVSNHSMPVSAKRTGGGPLGGHSVPGASDPMSSAALASEAMSKGSTLVSNAKVAEANADVASQTVDANVSSAKALAVKNAAEVDLVNQQSQSAKADAANKAANTLKTLQDMEYQRRRLGANGHVGDLMAIGSALDDTTKSVIEGVKSGTRKVVDKVTSSAKAATNKLRDIEVERSKRYRGIPLPSIYDVPSSMP